MLEGNNEILALADALRVPLLRLRLNSQSVHDPALIQTVTDHALRDIDAFITMYSGARESQLQIEPVALGSVLLDTAQRLKPYAGINNAVLYIDDHSKHRLVLANADLLSRGFEMVAKTLCDLTSDVPEPVITLRADTRHGYPRLGVYRSDIEISAHDLKMAHRLIGGARVNAGLFTQLGALRVMIATRLFESLDLTLRSAKSGGNHGLALQLSPSSQIGLFGEI